MNQAHCHSCAMPLSSEMQGPTENLCKYCCDENGQLKSREEVQAGLAMWLQSWGPGMDEATARARAADYMKAMPAWAE